MRVLAAITEPAVIRKILAACHLPGEAPKRAPAGPIPWATQAFGFS